MNFSIAFIVLGVVACVLGVIGIIFRRRLTARGERNRVARLHVVSENERLGMGIGLGVAGLSLILVGLGTMH